MFKTVRFPIDAWIEWIEKKVGKNVASMGVRGSRGEDLWVVFEGVEYGNHDFFRLEDRGIVCASGKILERLNVKEDDLCFKKMYEEKHPGAKVVQFFNNDLNTDVVVCKVRCV